MDMAWVEDGIEAGSEDYMPSYVVRHADKDGLHFSVHLATGYDEDGYVGCSWVVTRNGEVVESESLSFYGGELSSISEAHRYTMDVIENEVYRRCA